MADISYRPGPMTCPKPGYSHLSPYLTRTVGTAVATHDQSGEASLGHALAPHIVEGSPHRSSGGLLTLEPVGAQRTARGGGNEDPRNPSGTRAGGPLSRLGTAHCPGICLLPPRCCPALTAALRAQEPRDADVTRGNVLTQMPAGG